MQINVSAVSEQIVPTVLLPIWSKGLTYARSFQLDKLFFFKEGLFYYVLIFNLNKKLQHLTNMKNSLEMRHQNRLPFFCKL